MIKAHINAELSYESVKEMFKFLIENGFSVDMEIVEKTCNIEAQKDDNQKIEPTG